jgi:ribosomal protein L40E
MDSPLPAPWSYAARAAYFGYLVCPFCDHRNSAGAKFCSDCGSPLHLKPCNQCDAVNSRAATNCYKCGAKCPALFTTPEAAPVLPAADPTPAWPALGDVGVSATVRQPLWAAAGIGWRLTVLATIMIAGAYAAYRINAATPDAMAVASQPIDASEHSAPTAAYAVPMAVESKLVEPETTAALEAPMPTTNPEAPKRASARQTPAPVPATKRASARQTPAPVPATKRASAPHRPQSLASASVGAPGGETRKARRPDPWEAMYVSLSRCGGDLIARIVCDQRVRRRFCEGHWGEAPGCGSSIASDRG